MLKHLVNLLVVLLLSWTGSYLERRLVVNGGVVKVIVGLLIGSLVTLTLLEVVRQLRSLTQVLVSIGWSS